MIGGGQAWRCGAPENSFLVLVACIKQQFSSTERRDLRHVGQWLGGMARVAYRWTMWRNAFDSVLESTCRRGPGATTLEKAQVGGELAGIFAQALITRPPSPTSEELPAEIFRRRVLSPYENYIKLCSYQYSQGGRTGRARRVK